MKSKILILNSLLLITSFLFSQPFKSDFKISQDNQPSTILQMYPKLFIKNSNEFILTWTDYRKGTEGIYAQLYDQNGSKIGNNFQIYGNYDLIFIDDSTFISVYDSRSYFDMWYIDVSFYGNLFVNQKFKRNVFLGNLSIPVEGVVQWFNSISSFIYHNNRIISFLLDGGIAKRVITQLSDGSSISEQISTNGRVADVQSDKLTTGDYALFYLNDSLRIGYLHGLYGNFYDGNDSLLITKKLLSLDQPLSSILKVKAIDSLYNIFLLQDNRRTLKIMKVDRTGNLIGSIDSVLLTNPYGISTNRFSDLIFSNVNNNLFYLFTSESDLSGNTTIVKYLLEFNREGIFTGNIWTDTSLSEVYFEKQFFNVGNGNFFAGLYKDNDVHKAKLNLFNLLNYVKTNDDLTGSNEYIAYMTIKNDNQNFIFYNDEVGWKGRFVSPNGDLLSEEKRINVNNLQFFSNGNAVSLWLKKIGETTGICGFKYFDDNLNLIKVDTLKDNNDYLYIFDEYINYRVIDDSKILVVYRKENTNYARLQNIDGTLVREIILGPANLSTPKIFKQDDSTYVINWSNQIGFFDHNLNSKSPVYSGDITLYFNNYTYLYTYSTFTGYPPIRKYYGVIKNINGDSLKSIYFGEFYYGFNVHPIDERYFMISYSGYDSVSKNFYVKSYTTGGNLSRGPVRINQSISASRNNLTTYAYGDKIIFLWSDNRNGNFDIYASIFDKGIITSVDDITSPNEKIEFKLEQNYPNPFNSKTKITYTVSDFGFTSLKIYDLLGREITTLVNKPEAAGKYEIEFDAGKYNLSSGIYIYQLRQGNKSLSKKFVLLK